jgi:hypothetical protein
MNDKKKIEKNQNVILGIDGARHYFFTNLTATQAILNRF